MKKIVISYPDFFTGEEDELIRMLRCVDIWRVHIRKPGHEADDVRRLIEAIPRAWRYKISIHDHPDLAKDYELGGIHLNRRNTNVPNGWSGLVSRSLHSVDEIDSTEYDYAFLSPMFPSISKPGYSPALSLDEISAAGNNRIFALGGMTESRLDQVKRMGFGGAAFLGSVWRWQPDKEAFRLQFITHPAADRTIRHEVEDAIAGGCRWIQLRHKNADTVTMINEGQIIADLCRRAGATFIIDDRTDLVDTLGADGVHLGKNDMPVREARKLLGPRKIIGATANSFEDIRRAHADGADYIGLGPFRITTTKTNLSPVLGLSGYEKIMGECAASGISLPVVAIGGITAEDASKVMYTGVNGIAISSEIINAVNPTEKTRRLIEIVSGCTGI